jgi:hypothetical protein
VSFFLLRVQLFCSAVSCVLIVRRKVIEEVLTDFHWISAFSDIELLVAVDVIKSAI